jgi:hypothetical protein
VIDSEHSINTRVDGVYLTLFGTFTDPSSVLAASAEMVRATAWQSSLQLWYAARNRVRKWPQILSHCIEFEILYRRLVCQTRKK